VTELPAEYDVPRAADERTTLLGFLDRYRAVARRKAVGVDADGMRLTVGASPLTIGAIVKHLAYVEDIWFTACFAGNPMDEPWNSAPLVDDPDWDLHSAADDEPADLLALFDAACARSRAAVGSRPLDDHTAIPYRDGSPQSLRWVVVHIIEEYARHVGHLDLLRETVDGSVGD